MIVEVLISLSVFCLPMFLWPSISVFYFDGAFLIFEIAYCVYLVYSVREFNSKGSFNDTKLFFIPYIFVLTVIVPTIVVAQIENIKISNSLAAADLASFIEDYKWIWMLPILNVIAVFVPWGRIPAYEVEVEQEDPIEMAVSDSVPEGSLEREGLITA